MESKQPPTIIVIKKKKREAHSQHGGAWKVAYADFVTAMMALFIVLWIGAQDQEIREAVANYFKDPGVFKTGKTPTAILEVESFPIQKSPVNNYMRRREQENFEGTGNKIQQTIKKHPNAARLQNQIAIEVTTEGMQIELREKPAPYFFDAGKPDLSARGIEALQMIVQEIRYLPNRLIIETHVEQQYLQERYATLQSSTNLGTNVYRHLVAAGIADRQVQEIRGCADSQLSNPNNPFDISNRRFRIIVLFGGIW